MKNRFNLLFNDVINGLVEYHPLLNNKSIVDLISKVAKENYQDSGNNQQDYEKIRDNVENLVVAALRRNLGSKEIESKINALRELHKHLSRSFEDDSTGGAFGYYFSGANPKLDLIYGIADERLPSEVDFLLDNKKSKFDMIIVDSGNLSGDSWKYIYHSSTGIGTFYNENPIPVHVDAVKKSNNNNDVLALPRESTLLIDVANKVCKDLPDGYQAKLCMEHNAVWVELFNQDGCLITLDDVADTSISEQLDEALVKAIQLNEIMQVPK